VHELHDAAIAAVIDPEGEIPPDKQDAYDVVFCFSPLYAAAEPADLLAACRKLLAPAGLLVLALPTGATPWLDLLFALSQIGGRKTDMGLSGTHTVAGDWPAWTSAAGFSSCDVVGDLGLPKAFLLARANDRPTAGRFTMRPTAADVQAHRDAQLTMWRDFWRSPVSMRRELLVELLRGQLAKLVRGATPAEIDVSRPIFELGVDSLLAAEWQNQLDLTFFSAAVPGMITPDTSVESFAAQLAKVLNDRF
jgi:hypothetical protein